ncbi:DUF3027 domain-containing protein [Dietzia sp. JS16-p6b]|nr:DUF3027 domain-containing protein [Dietzia sp. JS16-p6b]QGW23867.1 hypothetical protein GJR88_01286 [Dietzia sp. DQ12-45-1b]
MPYSGPNRDVVAMARIMGRVNTEVDTDQEADPVSTDQASGFDEALRERLASGVDVARAAVEEFAVHGVGEHLGSVVEAPFTTTHRFASDLAGYRGWYWACVLALVPGGEVTVDEISLLPGPGSVVAPEWVPWEKRIRPGDLGAGDLLPPAEDDERLVPGQFLTGDDELDEVAGPVGLGRPRHLSREGRSAAAARWAAARGPDSEIARGARHHCGSCGFLLPISGSLGAMFGVCANEYSADGQVVHLQYGCGAHSEVQVATESTAPVAEAYDDAAVDVVVLPQQLAASAARARGAADAQDQVGETGQASAPDQA